jgi:glycosyltransferase involved in cell wall biosynthesis
MNDSSPCIIITQREGFSRSIESLKSVLGTIRSAHRLIYVDGGSPPAVHAELAALSRQHGFRLLREDRFLSPNEAKVLGASHATGRYVAFLENDILVEEGWLERLVECIEETGAGVVAPLYLERLGVEERLHMFGGRCRITDSNGKRVLDVTHEDRKGNVPVSAARSRTEHIEMHGFLLQASLLHHLELFDPAIPTIPENADFCLQVAAAGRTLWIEPASRVTVLLPEDLDPMDREFFRRRWSDDWIEQGFARFRSKWRLEGHQPVLESQRRWAVAHRMVAFDDALHRRLGVKSDSIVNRRLLAPVERRLLGR